MSPLWAVLAPMIVAPATDDVATAEFERMKALAGTWRLAGRAASPLRIRFTPTASGTVLVEEWLNAGKPHSMTVYHRDGARLIATHYCPQGNQPRLAATPRSDAAGPAFTFLDATDLDTASESYLVALSFDLRDSARPVRRETYREGGGDAPSELALERDGASAPTAARTD